MVEAMQVVCLGMCFVSFFKGYIDLHAEHLSKGGGQHVDDSYLGVIVGVRMEDKTNFD